MSSRLTPTDLARLEVLLTEDLQNFRTHLSRLTEFTEDKRLSFVHQMVRTRKAQIKAVQSLLGGEIPKVNLKKYPWWEGAIQ